MNPGGAVNQDGVSRVQRLRNLGYCREQAQFRFSLRRLAIAVRNLGPRNSNGLGSPTGRATCSSVRSETIWVTPKYFNAAMERWLAKSHRVLLRISYFSLTAWTARKIFWYDPQRHKLPERHSRISSSLGAGFSFKSATVARINPGVQYAH